MATKFYAEDRYRIRKWNGGRWIVLFGHPFTKFSLIGHASTHANAVRRMEYDMAEKEQRR